jgi:signal peptidase I
MPDDNNPQPPSPPRQPVEISLNPKAAPRPAAAPKKAAPAKPAEDKDSFREVIETIVFVVVLVLLLKTFLAEAFVIPTGSMATTLLGYHREVTCPKCGYSYLVNASKEADPQESQPLPVVSATCPNCEYTHRISHGLGGGAP